MEESKKKLEQYTFRWFSEHLFGVRSENPKDDYDIWADAGFEMPDVGEECVEYYMFPHLETPSTCPATIKELFANVHCKLGVGKPWGTC